MSRREPLSNIGMYCKDHSPKVEPRWASYKPSFFIGKFVKRAFTADKTKGVELEHMWLRVTGVDMGVLVGVLNNDPQFVRDLRNGAIVQCHLHDIEAVIDASGNELTP